MESSKHLYVYCYRIVANKQGGCSSYFNWVGSATITFPVAFSALLGAYSSMLKNGSVGDYRDVFSATTTNMVVGADRCARYWLAIGK